MLGAISRLLAHARDAGWIAASTPDPCPEFRRMQRDKTHNTQKHRKAKAQASQRNRLQIPADELTAILEEAERSLGLEFRPLILLADGAFRQSEVLGLRWSDYNGTHLTVSGQWSKRHGGYSDVTKTGHERLVQCSARLRGLLNRWKLESSGVYICDRGDGEPLRDGRLGILLARCCQRAGTQRYTPKDFRSTWASVMGANHIPERYVAAQIGDAEETVRVYYDDSTHSTYVAPTVMESGLCPADLVVAYQFPNSIPNTGEESARVRQSS